MPSVKSKVKIEARCEACGHTEPRWLGRCPACDSWGSMQEVAAAARPTVATARAVQGHQARPIAQVPRDDAARAKTGIEELDRVLGGGIVAGSVVLFGGEPGAGKSTLLLQAADAVAARGKTVLYVSAEESPGQVRLRAERLGALHEGLLLASENDMDAILELARMHDPDLVIVDSVQTVRSADAPGQAGGVAQVRAVAEGLVRHAKEQAVACVLVGHVTKDGQLAGPRLLEHLVDTVCEIEGDRHHALRLLRATKNRFGPAGEVGCFEMTDAGLQPVKEAGRLFLGDAGPQTAGIAVTVALEGRRPLACEVQALTTGCSAQVPRRVASGLDPARLHLVLAVLERHMSMALGRRDVFVSSVGGVRLVEPATDLALAVAIASSEQGAPVPRGMVLLAEVGLGGDLRLVAQTERRLAEAARLGFTSALLPAAYDGERHGLRVHRARDIRSALGHSNPAAGQG